VAASTARARRLLPSDSQFTLDPDNPHYSVNAFVQSLQQWCELLNRKLTKEGLHNDNYALGGAGNTVAASDIDINPVIEYLTMTLTADTSLQVTGLTTFWNCYAIEVSTYGIGLLGLNRDQFIKYDERFFMTRVEDVLGAQIFDTITDPANVTFHGLADAALNTSDGLVLAEIPLYQSCDQRISVSVSCHLPMDSHVIINNGVQASSRIIAKAYFENNILSTIEFNEVGAITGQTVRARVYADQDHMIKKTDGDIQWNRLASSYRLRYLRFYLHANYKLFGTDTFSIVEEEFKLGEDDYWQFTCRFISDY
jgi:hypothetical protein